MGHQFKVWCNKVQEHVMDLIPENLSSELRHLASRLRRVDQRLQSETAPDSVALNEFRQAVDTARLTAWSVSELINAQRVKKDPDTVLAFLAAERLRRFDQMVRNLCGDIERRVVTLRTNGMQSLIQSVNTLQERLTQSSNNKER
jgi:hypothetical protein